MPPHVPDLVKALRAASPVQVPAKEVVLIIGAWHHRQAQEGVRELPPGAGAWLGCRSLCGLCRRLARLPTCRSPMQHKLQPRPLELNQFLEINEHVWGTGLTGDGNMPFHRRDSFTRLRNGQVTVDDFELLKVLGKGSFGKVFLVRLIPTGGIYAMKVLKKSEVVRRRQVEHTKAERRIMEGVDHPFIVQLRYAARPTSVPPVLHSPPHTRMDGCPPLRFAFQTADKLYMVTDYCRGGELFFHLKKCVPYSPSLTLPFAWTNVVPRHVHRCGRGCSLCSFRVFPENMVRFYMAELTLALEHLHDNDVVYRCVCFLPLAVTSPRVSPAPMPTNRLTACLFTHAGT